MGVTPYSAFFTRLLIMNFFLAAAVIMVLGYVKKIRKNPEASLLYDSGWRPEYAQADVDENQILKKVDMNWRKIAVIVIFIGQYLVIAMYSLLGGDSSLTFDFMIAVMLCTMILVGFIGGMTPEELGQNFVKGLSSMAFVAFVIGLAKVISLVLGDGNVIHTIVYVLTKPLMELPKSVASIGLTIIVSIINPIIPSATSKAAILVPIMKPVAEALGMQLNLAVVAYQMGDSFTNLLSPLLMDDCSCVMADVPFAKWFKWVFPKVLLFILLACLIVFVLTATGWSGVI